MSYDIIIGRDSSDKEKFGDSGLITLGKGFVKMGLQSSLSNMIKLDVARSHVILVAGKRGSGKSYTLGVLAEELAHLPQEDAKNLSSIIFDTMGIFWTMKHINEKDTELLKAWNLDARPLNVQVFVPFGKAESYKEKGIMFDKTFALKPSELEGEDWLTLFNISLLTSPGALLQRTIANLKQSKKIYSLEDIKHTVNADHHTSNENKEIVSSLIDAASSWGIFSTSTEGTEIRELIQGGKTTVLDVSVYSSASSFNVRALVLGIITRSLFRNRMDARKKEELESLQHGQDYMSYKSSSREPLVWLFVDEAHEFLPKNGSTPATESLIQLLREGRQPGISTVLATQQPGQIHHDVMSQSDIVISHRLTSKQDLDALNEIMQSYVLDSIKKQMDDLPSLKGSAIILDDNSERLYPLRVRPRYTWHGGEAPSAIKSKIKL